MLCICASNGIPKVVVLQHHEWEGMHRIPPMSCHFYPSPFFTTPTNHSRGHTNHENPFFVRSIQNLKSIIRNRNALSNLKILAEYLCKIIDIFVFSLCNRFSFLSFLCIVDQLLSLLLELFFFFLLTFLIALSF